MWSSQTSQMETHQDAYEAVASLLRVESVWAEGICFSTIAANCNGPLKVPQCHTWSGWYDEDVRYWAGGHPKVTHQDAYEAVASLLRVEFVWAEGICFFTIAANCNGPLKSSSMLVYPFLLKGSMMNRFKLLFALRFMFILTLLYLFWLTHTSHKLAPVVCRLRMCTSYNSTLSF